MKVGRKVFDAHCHIGGMDKFPYYGLPEPVSPTVFEDPDRASKIKLMDELGVDRAVVMSNYGIPDPNQPFGLNHVVLEASSHDDKRIVGGIWFSPMGKMKVATLEALKGAGSPGIQVLKSTCLLGGTWDSEEWDDDTKESWDAVLATAREHDYVLHLHTSPGGGSDVSNCIKFVRKYGKEVKVHVVHAGGGVSGHIKFIPEFFNLIREGYQVYTDTSWAVGFGPRWLFDEIEKQGIGHDRVLFSSDEPWSDFWSEYYKIEGLEMSEELKNNVFWNNAERLYGG
ncbi:MAG: amidohydrolase [Deltaproteobacteria bacterium]|nr:amidohydrolase [Deltaproteobacteria bacterium]